MGIKFLPFIWMGINGAEWDEWGLLTSPYLFIPIQPHSDQWKFNPHLSLFPIHPPCPPLKLKLLFFIVCVVHFREWGILLFSDVLYWIYSMCFRWGPWQCDIAFTVTVNLEFLPCMICIDCIWTVISCVIRAFLSCAINDNPARVYSLRYGRLAVMQYLLANVFILSISSYL